MSSKPAIIRQRDLTRIVKGYAAAGMAVRCFVVDGVPHFEPFKPENGSLPVFPAVGHSGEDPVDGEKKWHL